MTSTVERAVAIGSKVWVLDGSRRVLGRVVAQRGTGYDMYVGKGMTGRVMHVREDAILVDDVPEEPTPTARMTTLPLPTPRIRKCGVCGHAECTHTRWARTQDHIDILARRLHNSPAYAIPMRAASHTLKEGRDIDATPYYASTAQLMTAWQRVVCPHTLCEYTPRKVKCGSHSPLVAV